MIAEKSKVFSFVGVVGSMLANSLGGWDTALQTLMILMIVDMVSGLALAGLFRKSTKTELGALDSKVGWNGFTKKCMIITFVLIGAQLDKLAGGGLMILGLNLTVRDMVIIGYSSNELISITENAGLMGLPIPAVIKRAIEVLEKQSNIDNSENHEEESR